MRTVQWKRGPSIVVKNRRLPLRRVMAVRTRRDPVLFGKLTGMDILMALLTLFGGGLEVHAPRVLGEGRFVA